ncbi:MAG: carbohydrate kinase family protein [Actinomycetota bacterium]
MSERPEVVVVGDVMLDVSVEAGALARGGDVHGHVTVRPGGAGANAAVWAAAGGARSRLIGRVGDDLAGRLLREAVAGRGVVPHLAVDPDAPSGTLLAVLEAGERSMVADRGANARLSPDDLPPAIEAAAVLVSGYLFFDPGSLPAATAAVGRARAPHVAVDAASWPLVRDLGPERFLRAAEGATLVLANEAEAHALTGLAPEEAAATLARRFGWAGVKLGPRGAVLATGDGLIRMPAPAVEEADPTGAGDAFDGVLLAALAAGDPPEEALGRACRAGASAAASPSNWPEP